MKLQKIAGVLAMSVLLFAPSCTITSESGQTVSLEEATEAQYEAVRLRVSNSSLAAAALLQIGLAENVELRNQIAELAETLAVQVQQNELAGLTSGNIITWVLGQFGEKLELEPGQIAIIQGISRLIDATVGEISLGIEGTLSPRQQGIVLAVLEGLALGIR